jgi:hypothetical protein
VKKDWFRRGVRMQHPFGDLEGRSDPWGTRTFEESWPKRVDDLSKQAAGKPLEIQQYGEHQYREAPSPVCKPAGGYASLNGPAPDLPQIIGTPIPVGTKRRIGPNRTDK